MINVKNDFGVLIDFDTAVSLMDSDIVADFDCACDYDTEQEYFDAYCIAHYKKFGETWELDKPNPVY